MLRDGAHLGGIRSPSLLAKNNWADAFIKFHFDVRQKLTDLIDVFYNGLEHY